MMGLPPWTRCLAYSSASSYTDLTVPRLAAAPRSPNGGGTPCGVFDQSNCGPPHSPSVPQASPSLPSRYLARDAAVLEDEGSVREQSAAELVVEPAHLEAGSVARHQEAAEACGDGALPVGTGIDEVQLGHAAARDVVLGPVDDVFVTLLDSVGLDGGAGLVEQEVRVGAGVGLRPGESQEEGVVFHELGQPLVAQFRGQLTHEPGRFGVAAPEDGGEALVGCPQLFKDQG